MKPREIENLIAVKSMLAEKYRLKANRSKSLAKRQQSLMKATNYRRQAETLKAQAAG